MKLQKLSKNEKAVLLWSKEKPFRNENKEKFDKKKISKLRFLGQIIALIQLISAIQMEFWLVFSFWSSFETNFLYQNSVRTKARGFS